MSNASRRSSPWHAKQQSYAQHLLSNAKYHSQHKAGVPRLQDSRIPRPIPARHSTPGTRAAAAAAAAFICVIRYTAHDGLARSGSPSRSRAGIACPEGRQHQERRGGPRFPAEKRRRLLHLPTDANPSNAADEKAGRDPHDPRTVTCKSLRTVTPKTPAGLPHGPHGGPQPRGDVSIGCGPKLVTSSCSSAPTLRLCLRACVHPRRSARRVCMCAHELARPG